MTDDTANPKETAAQHMKESLKRIQEARAKATSGAPAADKGGKGPKGAASKGRMFRHQGR
jgi:hypothetical protein